MNSNRNYSQNRANKFAWFVIILTILVVIIAAVILIFYLRSKSESKDQTGQSRSNTTNIRNDAPLASLPDMPDKPKPKWATFNGCPPEGDAGDPELNKLKNRIDEGNYVPVDFDAIVKLGWPKGIERRNRSNWSRRDAEAIARYEGIPVSVVCYIAGVKLMGPESCNCHGADNDMKDYHVWISKHAGDDRRGSIVAEVSPSMRARHTAWDIKNLRKLVKAQQKVRISGWLMMDPEHPDQVGKTRGTIWEIHPIMLIEVEQNGKWMPIDNLQLAAAGDNNA
ncbi:MAG: hypothetical protein ACM34K_15455 [Bacillota bacterium]